MAEEADAALDALVAELEDCVQQLESARGRAVELRRQREAGRPWPDIVGDEERPLVVESISTVLAGRLRHMSGPVQTLPRIGGVSHPR